MLKTNAESLATKAELRRQIDQKLQENRLLNESNVFKKKADKKRVLNDDYNDQRLNVPGKNRMSWSKLNNIVQYRGAGKPLPTIDKDKLQGMLSNSYDVIMPNRREIDTRGSFKERRILQNDSGLKL